MIAYEELERALARWKARRTSGGGADAASHEIDADAVISERTYHASESSAEIDLHDAVLDES